MLRTASVLALLCLLSCKRSEEDKAARQRIFSQQQESAGGSAQAHDSLDAASLADQPQVAERLLQMPQAEVAQRLGPHKAQQRVQFAWFRGPGLQDGGSEVSLSEETTLLDGPGEDFSLRLANDHNQGLELVWVKGEVFVKSLYGPFHKRRTDRTDPPRVREQAMSGLATFDRLARGLKLKNAGETTSEGRKVVRYQVTGFGARPSRRERTDLPPVQYPDDKVDPDTARRLELWEKEEPSRVSGTLIVDAATSAPLACDLQGHFKVPGNGNGAAAELDLHTVLVTSAIGKDPGLKAPPFEPETTVPHAVKDPLRFLGKAPGTAPPAAEEPDESEEEEPAPPK
ncbi:MAG TPA: hypothetical protein VIR81_11695 [Myxococcales bacterium]